MLFYPGNDAMQCNANAELFRAKASVSIEEDSDIFYSTDFNPIIR